jgi:hypothetical protein
MTITKDEKKAEELKISQIGDFKKRMGGTMELPSGLVVKARNPGGLQAFMDGGIIPNNLMVIIKEALSKGKAPSVKDFMSTEGDLDPEMLAAMDVMLDAVVVKVIVEPVILPRPKTEAERSDEQLYADELPQDDKQFLLQWVSGGTRDLEKFRQQQRIGLDAVAASSGDVRAAQSAAGLDPR